MKLEVPTTVLLIGVFNPLVIEKELDFSKSLNLLDGDVDVVRSEELRFSKTIFWQLGSYFVDMFDKGNGVPSKTILVATNILLEDG